MRTSNVLLFLGIVCFASSAKILSIFPTPSKSHQILGSALLKELVKRGHEVTMISPFPLKNPPARYHEVILEELNEENLFKNAFNSSIFERIESGFKFVRVLNRGVLESKNMQTFMKSGEKFDLLILLSVVFYESFLGIGHLVNATTIGFSVVGSTPFLNVNSGNSAPYAYVPNVFTSYTDDMSFIQRVGNTCLNLLLELVQRLLVLPYQRSLLQEFFPEAPPLEELLDNLDLTLVNSHFSTETPRPYIPNLIQIGGFHLQETEELPVDIKNYLDTSKNGVIFFSLGSNFKSSDLPPETLGEILAGFKKIPYNVLWKFEKNLNDLPKNVRIYKWLPQRSVLAHPNVKAFITHGGLGSTVESIYYGVPMVCIPLFGDQEKNAADSVMNGYAVKIDKGHINEANLVEAIMEITDNPVYRQKAQLRSDLYKNQVINPMEKAMFWIEHVLKHKGAKHLKARGAKLPWYQYMLLDVIAFLAVGAILIMALVYFVFKALFNCCFKRKYKVKTQ